MRLRVPDNVTLLRLPPPAPELNPMENVWAYLRGNALGMTVWEGYTAIVDACCNAWNGLMKDAERITSITTRELEGCRGQARRSQGGADRQMPLNQLNPRFSQYPPG